MLVPKASMIETAVNAVAAPIQFMIDTIASAIQVSFNPVAFLV
jgi:hypothetical protein